MHEQHVPLVICACPSVVFLLKRTGLQTKVSFPVCILLRPDQIAFRIYADAWTPLDSVAAIQAVCEQTTRLIINLWRNFTAPQVSLLPTPSCALKTMMSREKAEVDFGFDSSGKRSSFSVIDNTAQALGEIAFPLNDRKAK